MNNGRNEIINNLRRWAGENKDINCVLVAGSQGNKNKISDEYSDVDAVVFARRRKFYDSDLSWIKNLGELASYHEGQVRVPLISKVHKIYFSNGFQLDLIFWDRRVLPFGYYYVYLKEKIGLPRLLPVLLRKIAENYFNFFPKYIDRGFFLLADKRNYRPKMEYIGQHFKYKQPPFSEKKLQHVVSRFWAYAYCTAIYIYRNELACAKIVGDHAIKYHLLELIELYAKLSNGDDYDVFEGGRYLERWAPDFIVRGLEHVYGRYDADDAWRATMETMDTFSHICGVLAKEHPEIRFTSPEQYFRGLIQGIYIKRTASNVSIHQH